MLDIKQIRENPQEVEKKLQTKEEGVSVQNILKLDGEIRSLKIEAEELKNIRNQSAKEVGEKKRQGEDVTLLLKSMEGAKEKISTLDHKCNELEAQLKFELGCLPNLPEEGIKASLDPADNVEIKTFGEKPSFSFEPKNHLELNEKLHLFDFKRGAKIGGSGWPAYRGMGARLEWALINFMIDTHVANGFEQWIPPLLGRSDILFGSAHLPKFEDQLFKLRDKDHDLYLIPTSEAVLNGIHYDEILKEEELPLKYTAYTPCFRREAGAAGAGERGLIRTHQFNKVEIFCVTRPEESEKIYNEMVESAETILQALNIHYRSMLLVTGDMSFASAKTIDLEVWLPGQNRYYEVSSISNCTDFQARRSKIRFKRGEGKPELAHTLNGSGLATSRLMVALLENNQQEDGSVTIPPVLHKYLGGVSQLGCSPAGSAD
ncbi:serine--tRNA ligase [Candidatus Neptunochlamydia vexilliferae]|nr:serine--tRNA ligase [Candidatus Neptunochlamydia vexilliferae]